MIKRVELPLTEAAARQLHVGDTVELSGNVLTGRDQACACLAKILQQGGSMPVHIRGELIYFVGPSPARPGEVIGSAGPTTSSRMNRFIPQLLAAGMRGLIGKGFISAEAKAALRRHSGVYFGAIGGTGALLSRCIQRSDVAAFPELLSEAVHRLEILQFPVMVLHDTEGNDLYERTYGELNEN